MTKTTDRLEVLSDALAAVAAALVDVPGDVRLAVLQLALVAMGPPPPPTPSPAPDVHHRAPARVRSYPDSPPPPARKVGRKPGRKRDTSAVQVDPSHRVSREHAEETAAAVVKLGGTDVASFDVASELSLNVATTRSRLKAAEMLGLVSRDGELWRAVASTRWPAITEEIRGVAATDPVAPVADGMTIEVRRVSESRAQAAAAWIVKRGKPTSYRDFAAKEGISVSRACVMCKAAVLRGLLSTVAPGVYAAPKSGEAAA